MKTKTITLPVELWEQILKALENYTDEGPEHEGWRSVKLHKACVEFENALNAN